MLNILPEVKLGDGLGGEKHVPEAIGSCGPHCHWHAAKVLTDLEDAAEYRNPAFIAYTSYKVHLDRTPSPEASQGVIGGSRCNCWPG